MALKIYDYACDRCNYQKEMCVQYDARDSQKCMECESDLRRMATCRLQKAFTPHFSERLGVYLEDRQQEEREIHNIRERSQYCLPPEERSEFRGKK